jgi:hypothetical protein
MLAFLVLFSSLVSSAFAQPAPRIIADLGKYPTAVSGDGSRAAIYDPDRAVLTVWDTRKGRPTAQLDLAKPKGRKAEELVLSQGRGAFSRDGKWLYYGRGVRDDDAGTETVELYLVDLVQEKIARKVFESEDRCGRAHKPYDKSDTMIFALCSGPGGGYFMPGFESLAVAPDGGKASFLLAKVKGRHGEYDVYWHEVSADGKELRSRKVYSMGVSDKKPSFPDLATDGRDTTLGGYDDAGRVLAVSDDDSTCQVVDLGTDKRVSFLEGCTGQMGAFTFTADRSRVSAFDGRERRLRSWSVADGSLLADAKVGPALGNGDSYSLSADGRSLAVYEKGAGEQAVAAVYATATGQRVGAVPGPLGELLYGLVAFTADRVVVWSKSGDKDGLRLYALGDGAAPEPAAQETPALDLDAPPSSKTKLDPDAYAVVIGVERYRQEGIPAVDFAARDAKMMYSYLTRSMGFDAKNVVLLTDDKATRTDLNKYLGKWLQNRVGPKSRVFVYYAGHGSPNPATGEGYLMPYEADPAYLEDTAFPIARLYAELGKLPAKDITVVLDACFSGQGGRSLIAKGARPLVQVKQAAGPGNALVLAAASGAQISASDAERRHGLLTAYVLEALHGAADARGDGKITGDEIYAFVRPAVERAARLQNVEQTPVLSGAPGKRPWIELK